MSELFQVFCVGYAGDRKFVYCKKGYRCKFVIIVREILNIITRRVNVVKSFHPVRMAQPEASFALL